MSNRHRAIVFGNCMLAAAMLLAALGCEPDQTAAPSTSNGQNAAAAPATAPTLKEGEAYMIARLEIADVVIWANYETTEDECRSTWGRRAAGELVELVTGKRRPFSLELRDRRLGLLPDGEIYDVVYRRKGEGKTIYTRDIASISPCQNVPPECLKGMLRITARIECEDPPAVDKKKYLIMAVSVMLGSAEPKEGTLVDIHTGDRYPFAIDGPFRLWAKLLNGDVYDLAIDPPADGEPVTSYNVVLLKRRDDLSPPRDDEGDEPKQPIESTG